MRSDELANEAYVENDAKFRKRVPKGLGLGVGAASAGALALSDKLTPFLSKYIPVDLAIKGISKINPQWGNFLKRGQALGLDVKEGIDHLKNQSSPQQPAKEDSNAALKPEQPVREDRNIVEQYSPSLHQYMIQAIKQGKNPFEAGTWAKTDDEFLDAIRRMQKDHKIDWFDIIQNVYGNGEKVQKTSPSMQPEPMGKLIAAIEKLQQARGRS